jgi:hypothetical protein
LIEKASHVDKEVLVFTPEEITTLLNGAKRELVPALAIGAFAGVRSEELKRLDWDKSAFGRATSRLRVPVRRPGFDA